MQLIVSLFAVAGAMLMTAFGVRVEQKTSNTNVDVRSSQEISVTNNDPLATTLAESVKAEEVFTTPTSTPRPTPAAPSPQPTATPATEPDTTPGPRASISFIDFPTEIQSGKSFTIAWIIEGPPGATVTQASLETSYNMNASSGTSTSSVSNNSTQGYGSFTLPKTLSANHTYSGAGATVEVTAKAEVNGQTVIERKTLTVQ